MLLYKHQKETVEFLLKKPRAFITSTPGTGKTISTIEATVRRNDGKTLVIAPKTILDAAWGNDLRNYYPGLRYDIFRRKLQNKPDYVKNLLNDNDYVIINIEAADKFLKIMPADYKTLVIDEFTMVKNRQSKRSKRVLNLAQHFEYRILLSGTPTPNDITDIWHPALILDDGQRLGSSFFKFRSAVCVPVQKGFSQQFVEWQALPNAAQEVGAVLRDITIRHELEEVIDMPERIYRTLSIEMSPALKKSYATMKKEALLELDCGTEIVGINAAVVGNKLLQIASGSVYDEDGEAVLIHTEKYDLVHQLISERDHSIVFYQWQHQCDAMESILTTAKIKYAVINGKTSQDERVAIVNRYQKGYYQTILIQPAAAAHGITLTQSTTSIWISPTFNLEHFSQANHRDYRIGQKKRSEVIMLQYDGTIEQQVYAKLQGKADALKSLLEILKT